MKSMFHKFIKDRSGVTAVEYCLISGLIAIALISGASSFGNAVNESFTIAADHIKDTQ